MNTYNPQMDMDQPGAIVTPTHSLHNLAAQQGIHEAINQENALNQQERAPEDYQQQLLGYDEPIPEDEHDLRAFEDEPLEEEEKKPKKKYNDSKKRINQLTAEKKAERDQKENALLRAEIAEREVKRLADEKAFLMLNSEKSQIENAEYEQSQRWAQAHEEGDSLELQRANRELQELADLRRQKDLEISHIADKYTRYQDEYEQQASEEQDLTEKQYEALVEFSDKRELESPLYEGFLKHHDFLSPFSENYDARLVERVEPVKFDFIQELKLNGQSDEIGTKDFFEELSHRIHLNLNPRLNPNYQHRGDTMTTDPRYQQPNYMTPDQYQRQMQQQRPPQQQQYPQQNYQQQYPQQQYQQPMQQQYPHQPSVAPVNRSGYSNNYSTDPRDIALDEQQREAANLFGPALNELSKKVYGRGMDSNEVEDLYKRGLSSQNRR